MGSKEGMQNNQNDPVRINNNNKCAREQDKPNGEEPLRKLRAKACVDYHFLDKPFPDEEQNGEYNVNKALIAYNVQTKLLLGSRDPLTHCEAQKLPDWPEWKKAILIELEQLQQMDTLNLVSCPKGSVLIANKWVFFTKYNKQGELIKYKAWLVAKGCAQRPGYDYMDTFFLVVWLETIQVILPIVIRDKLKIQQMDVKAAYLNVVLQEKVYM